MPRDIAIATELHESTVSRVTSNKYIATPRGIFELKYFFTSALPARTPGVVVSSESVRSRIRHLVSGENAHQPLSDDRIVDLLKGEGVEYHTYGWPAPPSDRVQLITNAYLLPNMIAKAVTGTATKDAIAWAEGEMKKIMAG